MSLTAIALVLLSAFMHAAWNLQGKRGRPSGAFFLVASGTAALLLAPLLIVMADRLVAIPPRVWALLVLSGFFMAVYYLGLASAYRLGDMSVAYPLARAAPAVFVVAIAVTLGQGQSISTLCAAGVLLILLGGLLLPMRRFDDLRLSNYLNACCLAALLAALGTSGYSVNDDAALRILRDSGPRFGAYSSAAIYVVLEAGFCAAWLALMLLPRRRGRDSLRSLLRDGWTRAAAVGVMILATYGLVLAAMAFARNVSYVVAFRQLSIPLGALLGVALLREPCPPPKVVAVIVLVAGLVLVAIG